MADAKVSTYGTGQFVGTYALLSVPRQVAAALLDPLLEPGPQQMTPAGEHPIYFALGRHTEVRGSWPVFRNFAIAYNEAFVLVPYVRFRGGTRDFLHMPRLYLDQLWPTWLGLYVFGFNKHHADVVYAPERFIIRERGAAETVPALWSANMQASDQNGEPEKERARRNMDPVFGTMPFVGIRRVLGSQSELACWMSFADTRVDPIRMDLGLHDSYLRQCGLKDSYRFGAPGSDGAAMHVEYKWTLTFPTGSFDR